MRILVGLLAAIIGAVVGAAIWVAVAYFANYELGLIAWGIGGLVGFGMFAGSGGRAGPVGGVLAALVAIASIALAKVTIVVLLTGGLAGFGPMSDRDAVTAIADRHAYVAEVEDGRQLQWPAGMSYQSATAYEDYPADVIALADEQWRACPPAILGDCRMAPQFAIPEFRTSVFADAIMAEQSRNDLSLPPGATSGFRQKHYPADVWAEALAREAAMTEAEQAAYFKPIIENEWVAMQEAAIQGRVSAFQSMFSAWDLLWLGLATVTAFRIGGRQTAPAAPAGPAA